MAYELFIEHENLLYFPPVVDGVTIEWERVGQPGKLSFEVVKTETLNFEEGDACRFSVDGKPMFFGFVFDKSRAGKNSDTINVVVYDQLRYLKNKTFFGYQNKTASEVIKMLAEDFKLRVGALADTKHIIVSRSEDNKTLFDIFQHPLDETLKATGQLYVLYDDAGEMMLKNINDMKLDIIIDFDTAGDFDYKSSISGETYNVVALYRDGEQKPVTAIDETNVGHWGVLQYTEKVSDENVNLQSMADSLLKLYNEKTRNLSAKDVLGDVRVRGGSSVIIV